MPHTCVNPHSNKLGRWHDAGNTRLLLTSNANVNDLLKEQEKYIQLFVQKYRIEMIIM